MTPLQTLKNQRGVTTVDYLFSFVLVSGFSLVILTFSATLSVVEIVQYMAFASSRNYFASHTTEDQQKAAARKKFAELKANSVIAPLLNGGWFSVPDDSLIVDFNIPAKYNDYQGYAPSDPRLNLVHGVIVEFSAKILDFQIPFFGATRKTDSGGGSEKSGFTTHITSFLGREPSFEECRQFGNARWGHIKNLQNTVGAAAYSKATSAQAVEINDNGC